MSENNSLVSRCLPHDAVHLGTAAGSAAVIATATMRGAPPSVRTAALVGATAAYAFDWSGVGVYLHEVGGHIGTARLLRHYPEDRRPTWRVVQWESLANLRRRPSLVNLVRFLFRASEGGVHGWSHLDGGRPSRVGRLIGDRMSNALVSIGGLVPGLLVDVASVSAGQNATGEARAALLTFGMFGHAMAGSYVAEGIDILRRGEEGEPGHDIVNFSRNVSRRTGLSPLCVAMLTGVLWFGSLFVWAALLMSGGEERQQHA